MGSSSKGKGLIEMFFYQELSAFVTLGQLLIVLMSYLVPQGQSSLATYLPTS